MLPVDRDDRKAALASLDTALEVLGRGEAFGIYPEGTRSRDGRLYRGRTGVAHLALTAGAPVVPGRPHRHREAPAGRRPAAARSSRSRSTFGKPIEVAGRYDGVPLGKARRAGHRRDHARDPGAHRPGRGRRSTTSARPTPDRLSAWPMTEPRLPRAPRAGPPRGHRRRRRPDPVQGPEGDRNTTSGTRWKQAAELERSTTRSRWQRLPETASSATLPWPAPSRPVESTSCPPTSSSSRTRRCAAATGRWQIGVDDGRITAVTQDAADRPRGDRRRGRAGHRELRQRPHAPGQGAHAGPDRRRRADGVHLRRDGLRAALDRARLAR